MTIDKIRHYIGDDLFLFWQAQTSLLLINEAANTLRTEIQAGILTDIKYHAELKLLNILLENSFNRRNFQQPRITPAQHAEIERVHLFNTLED
jgi:hypothetical protein